MASGSLIDTKEATKEQKKLEEAKKKKEKEEEEAKKKREKEEEEAKKKREKEEEEAKKKREKEEEEARKRREKEEERLKKEKLKQQKKAVKKTDSKKGLAMVIEGPTNVMHVSHVGFDAKDGFQVDICCHCCCAHTSQLRNIPPEWKKLMKDAGVKKSDLRDAETATFILTTISESLSSGTSARLEIGQRTQGTNQH
jgi:superfamily II DNA/RNA helicase